MLNGDFHPDLRDDLFGLLKSHNTRALTLMSVLHGVNRDFTLAGCRIEWESVQEGEHGPSKKVLTVRSENEYMMRVSIENLFKI
jgi:hypothetical protein